MSMKWGFGTFVAAGILGLACLGARPAGAADVTALARDAGTALRTAQNDIFSGKFDDASAALAKAEGLVAALKAADPADAHVAALEQKCARVRKDLEARQQKPAPVTAPPAPAAAPAGAAAAKPPPAPGAAPAGATAGKPPTAPAAAPAGAAAAKLPAGATFRLKEADRALAEAERAAGSITASAAWRAQSAKAGIDTARGKLEEIRQQFGAAAPAAHPDIRAVEERIAALERQLAGVAGGAAAAQQAEQAAKAVSEAWAARLRPYVLGPGRTGHDKDKWMPASAPRALEELARAVNLQREAGDALEAFDKAGLKAPGDELSELARQLRNALDSFAASHKAFVEESVRAAGELLDQLDAFLKEQEAKAASGGEPLFLPKDQVGTGRARVERAAALTAADDARIAALRGRQAGLERRDAALRKARMAHARLTPDQYGGSDLKELKDKAGQIAGDAIPGAEVLRVTVISPDWKEESVIEPTDTTHTALRSRTTRSVTAQVAARAAGEVKLLTLDLSKDRQTGGAWGALYGHVMFTDPMLAENVEK